MNKIWINMISIVFLILSIITNSYAKNNLEHYIFHYESGNIYDAIFTDNTITWKGLEGDDKGQSETDYIKRKNLLENVEVIQWKETSGTFVTLIFDHKNFNIISSIKTNDGDWFVSGKASIN